jgi:hypothetical protein
MNRASHIERTYIKNPLFKIAAVALPCLLGLQGCHISQYVVGTTVTCPTTGPPCTVALNSAITIVPNVVAQTVGIDDLGSTSDGSYTVSASVPSSIFSADPNGFPTTTLTVTTDTGYSSSIILNLTPVAAAISPVNSGDVVFSYNLPSTPEFNAWIQQVAASTTSTMTLTTSAGLPLLITGAAGTYKINTVLTSNSVGTFPTGSMQLVRSTPPKGKPCSMGGICQPLQGPGE